MSPCPHIFPNPSCFFELKKQFFVFHKGATKMAHVSKGFWKSLKYGVCLFVSHGKHTSQPSNPAPLDYVAVAKLCSTCSLASVFPGIHWRRETLPDIVFFLVAILVKVFIIHHHKNDMHNMARSDFFWGGGSGFSSTKASNNTCSSCFHSLAEIGDLKKARPMISSENGFHGGSPEAHQQFWPKTFGSQLGRMKKKNKTKKPAFHTHSPESWGKNHTVKSPSNSVFCQ